MADSKRRIISRSLLLLVVLGLCVLIFLGWYQGLPHVLRQRAQTAIENQQWEKARLTLGTLLQKVPDDREAHLQIAEVLVNEARERGPRADYANLPTAFAHLLKAWELQPEEESAAEKLLAASIKAGRFTEARTVAAGLAQQQPRNPDVLYVLTGKAIAEKKYDRAQTLLSQLRELEGEPRPRSLALAERLLASTEDTEARKALWIEVFAQAEAANQDTDLSALAELAKLATIGSREGGSDTEAIQRADVAMRVVELMSDLGARRAAAQLAVEIAELISAKESSSDSDAAVRRQLFARTVVLGHSLIRDHGDEALRQPAAFLKLAQFAKAGEDFGKAIEILDHGLQHFQKTDKPTAQRAQLEMHLALAQHLIAQNKFEAAAPHLNALQADHRSAGWGHLLNGHVAMHEGRFERALVELNAAERSLGSTPVVRLALARTFVVMRRWQEALPYLESLRLAPQAIPIEQRDWFKENLGDGSALHLMLAQTHLALQNSQAAATHLQALVGTPLETTAIALQATYLWNTGRCEEALALIQSARERFDSNVALARLHAVFLEQQGTPEVACKLLEDLAAAYSDDLNVQILAYQWLATHGRSEAAAKWLTKLRQNHPQEPRLAFLEAQALMAEGKAAEALESARTLEGNAAFDTAMRSLGVVAALEMEDIAQANASLRDLQKQPSSSWELVGILKADVCAAQGDFASAVECLEDVMEHTRCRPLTAQTMHRALLKLAADKGPEVAEKSLQPLLGAYPNDPVLLLTKAHLQFQQQQYPQSLDSLERLAQLKPAAIAPVFLAARVMVAQNRRDEALDTCQEILRRQPDHDGARLLAIALNLTTKPHRALALTLTGRKYHPDNLSYQLTQALALAQLGRFAEARAVAETLCKADPASPQPYLVLAQVHVAKGEEEKALEVLAAAQSQLPANLDLLENQLRILSALKRDEAARQLAETVVAKAGGAMSAKIRCADLFATLKQWDAAEHWGRAALATGDPNRKDRTAVHLLLAEVAEHRLEASSDPIRKQSWARTALEEYKKARTLNPQNVVLASNVARLLATHAGQLAEAFEMSQEIRQAVSIPAAPLEVLETLSMIYTRAGKKAELQSLIDEAAASRPEERTWLLAKVNAALEEADLSRTLAEIEHIEKDHPQAAEPPYAEAILWDRLENPHKALRALHRALERNPDHVEARLLAIQQLERLGRWQISLKQANLTLQQDASRIAARVARAKALQQLGQDTALKLSLADSLSRTQKQLESDPDNPSLYEGIARLHQLAGNDAKAIGVLEAALNQDLFDVRLVAQLVQLHLARDDYAKAREVAERVLPQVSRAHDFISLGQTFCQTGLYDPARRCGHQARMLAKNADQQLAAACLLGDVAQAEGAQTGDRRRFLEARDHYRTVLQARPRHAGAGNNLAWLLAVHLDQPQEALEIGERVRGDAPASTLHPSFVDTLARAYRRAGRLEQAYRLLEDALVSYPEQGLLHLEQGRVFLASGNLEAARNAFATALALGLDNLQAEEAAEKLASLGQ